MPIADPGGAIATYLGDEIGDLVNGLIFRPELNTDDIDEMPVGAIVIRRAGGYQMFGAANIPVGDPRLDVFCYGETWFEAEQIAAAATYALKQLRNRVFDNGDGSRTRVLWARIEGGPMPYENPETDWPCHVVSIQVAHIELALA